MDRSFFEAKLLGSEQAYVADNNDAVLVDHDRLTPTKLSY